MVSVIAIVNFRSVCKYPEGVPRMLKNSWQKNQRKNLYISNSFLKLLFDICGHWFSLSYSIIGKKLKVLGHKMCFENYNADKRVSESHGQVDKCE